MGASNEHFRRPCSLSKRRRTAKPPVEVTQMGPDAQLEKEVLEYLEIVSSETFEPTVNAQQFWEERIHQFPELALIALCYLAMPASSAPVERLFSVAGYGSKGTQSNIAPPLLEAQTLCKFNRNILM